MALVIILAVVSGFVLSISATGAIRTLARRAGFVDHPGGHKQHDRAVALGGGIAIFLGGCLPILLGTLFARFGRHTFLIEHVPSFVRIHLDGVASHFGLVVAMIACALVLHIVGLIDDARALGPAIKFVVQGIVALITAWPMQIRIVEVLPAPVSISLTVLWIVLITNAFNFLDNMDGLSAGVACIAAGIFAISSMAAGQVFVPTMAWVLVGALAGFLPFNFSPASIFMGDAGSLVIGYLLAVLTILANYYDPGREVTPIGILVPLVVLAVPLYDVISVVVRRMLSGDNPFRGDRRHFSHRLVKRGMSPRGAVLTIYLATAATGLPAIVLPQLSWPFATLLLAQCVCVVVMIAILEHRKGEN